MLMQYVVLEAIKATGYSEWLVCEVSRGEALKVTNTCTTKEIAIGLARRLAEAEEVEYEVSLHR